MSTDEKRPTFEEACTVLMTDHGPGTAVYEAARVLLDRIVELETAERERAFAAAMYPPLPASE